MTKVEGRDFLKRKLNVNIFVTSAKLDARARSSLMSISTLTATRPEKRGSWWRILWIWKRIWIVMQEGIQVWLVKLQLQIRLQKRTKSNISKNLNSKINPLPSQFPYPKYKLVCRMCWKEKQVSDEPIRNHRCWQDMIAVPCLTGRLVDDHTKAREPHRLPGKLSYLSIQLIQCRMSPRFELFLCSQWSRASNVEFG